MKQIQPQMEVPPGKKPLTTEQRHQLDKDIFENLFVSTHETDESMTTEQQDLLKRRADKIRSLSKEGFLSVLQYMGAVKYAEESRDIILEPQIVRALLEKYFSLFEGTKMHHFTEGVDRVVYDQPPYSYNEEGVLLDVISNWTKKDSTKKLMVESVFSEYMSLVPKYPDQALKTWEMFWQTHAQGVSADVVISELVRLIPEKSAQSFLSRAIKDLEYLIASGNKHEFAKAIEKHLDFKNKEKYFETGVFLDLLVGFTNDTDEYAREDGVVDVVRESLAAALKTEDGSHFLRIKAEKIQNELALDRGYSSLNKPRVFELTKGVFVFHNGKSIKILGDIFDASESEYIHKQMAFEEKRDRVTDLNLQLEYIDDNFLYASDEEQIRKELAEAQNDLAKYVENEYNPADRDSRLAFSGINKKMKSVKELSMDKLTLSKDSTKSKQDYYDFVSFTSPAIRRQMEQDFNIHMSELSIPEQYSFLEYVKDVDHKNIEHIKEYAQIYGGVGLRTFLSLEHGGREMGNKIVELGELLSENDALEVFRGYSRLIDESQNIRDMLNKAFENGTEAESKISNEISSAIMLRAKDLLLGAHHVATNKSEKIDVKGLLAAIEGLSTTLSILADMEKNEKYTYTRKSETKNGGKYLVTSAGGLEYELKIFVRPQAEKNAQARINFEINFDTEKPNENLKGAFWNTVISKTQSKETKASVLRIGIDREDFDDKSSLSLDFGRSEREDDELSRTGDVLGNLLAEATEAGHHTIETFSPELAEEKVFADLAERFLKYLKSK